ncbi:hypothetical protein CKO50_23065, partial [Pseudoalteromonas sp. HM-SA03]
NYLAKRAKERQVLYQKGATEEEKREAELEAYGDRLMGYCLDDAYYEDLPKDHLHDLSYKERLVKAEELNGC